MWFKIVVLPGAVASWTEMAVVQRLQKTPGNLTLARFHVHEEAIVEILQKTSRVQFSLTSRCLLPGVLSNSFLAWYRIYWTGDVHID